MSLQALRKAPGLQLDHESVFVRIYFTWEFTKYCKFKKGKKKFGIFCEPSTVCSLLFYFSFSFCEACN